MRIIKNIVIAINTIFLFISHNYIVLRIDKIVPIMTVSPKKK